MNMALTHYYGILVHRFLFRMIFLPSLCSMLLNWLHTLWPTELYKLSILIVLSIVFRSPAIAFNILPYLDPLTFLSNTISVLSLLSTLGVKILMISTLSISLGFSIFMKHLLIFSHRSDLWCSTKCRRSLAILWMRTL